MEDGVDFVGAANFVIKFDVIKGFWQVPLTTPTLKISAFVTPNGFMSVLYLLGFVIHPCMHTMGLILYWLAGANQTIISVKV